MRQELPPPFPFRPPLPCPPAQSTISSASLAQKHWFRRLTSRRNVVPFFLTLLGTLIIILAVTLLTSMDRPKPKNLVLMVSDGMGPASLSLARSYMQYTEDVEFYKQLPLDPYIVGTSRTRSHGPSPFPVRVCTSHIFPCFCFVCGCLDAYMLDSLITDSAAGATARSATRPRATSAPRRRPRPNGRRISRRRSSGRLIRSRSER